MSTQQKELSIADDHIRFFQLSAPGPYGFDFPAFQRYSGLEAFLDEIIVERLLFSTILIGVSRSRSL